jgi:hypothetical protein
VLLLGQFVLREITNTLPGGQGPNKTTLSFSTDTLPLMFSEGPKLLTAKA